MFLPPRRVSPLLALGLVALTSTGCLVTWGQRAEVRDGDGDSANLGEDCDPADPEVQGEAVLYLDEDGDGLGDKSTGKSTCPAPGWVSSSDDCDDADSGVKGEQEHYVDMDGDGYTAGSDSVLACPDTGADQYIAAEDVLGVDCDDEYADRQPGADETCRDGVVQDCSDAGRDGELQALEDCNPWVEDGELSDDDVMRYGDDDDARLGAQMVPLGDVNGDGYPDLMVLQSAFEYELDVVLGPDWVVEGEETWTSPLSAASDGGYVGLSMPILELRHIPPVTSTSDANGGGVAALMCDGSVAGSAVVLFSLSSDPGSILEVGTRYHCSGFGGPSCKDAEVISGGSGAPALLVANGVTAVLFQDPLSLLSPDDGLDEDDVTLTFTSDDGIDEISGGTSPDLDGDGSADVAFSSWSPGAVWWVSGDDLSVGSDLELDDTTQLIDVAADLNGVGDLTGDGCDDLLATTDDGLVGLGSPLGGSRTDGPQALFTLSADLGEVSVAPAGDLDGDGRADLLLGFPTDDDDAGGAMILLGGDLPGDGAADLDDVAWVTLAGARAGDEAGASVAAPGDMDGDGLADLLIGAPGHEDVGAIYRLSLTPW